MRLGRYLAAGFLTVLALSPLCDAAPEKQGRILTATGDVQISSDQAATWRAIQAGEAIFDTNIVKTGRQSRCAILLVDETQLVLNAYTTMEIRKVNRGGKVVPAAAGAGPAETKLWMQQGEAWARSKNTGRSLAIETPAATAAIRGTEINLRVDGKTSEIVVVEGLVDLYNSAGAVTLRGGEGGRAEAGKPPQKFAVVSPADAVQWVLHYPEPERAPSTLSAAEAAQLASRLEQNPGDLAARLSLIDYRLQHREYDAALSLASTTHAPPAALPQLLRAKLEAQAELGRDVEEAITADSAAIRSSAPLLVEVASYHLRYGNPALAKNDLDAALTLDSRNQDALALRALIAITQNDVKTAEELINRSIAVNANHAPTQLVASKVSQARFDLEAALLHAQEAQRLAPDSVEAAASTAELLFGSGLTGEASAIVEEMIAKRPDTARLLTLSAFISLGLNQVDDATSSFEKAIQIDPGSPEAHLGLGLCEFYHGKREDGLVEMLTASFLAPNVSLYESYLGKAYFEERRFTEAFAALDTAKRIDPRDPTPYLYAGLFKRDLNRQGEAIEELQQAIARNDNRAVYRSRLLLDRDQSTRNVSLAQIYSEVGFSALGAYHATRSIDLDYGNSAAHLFAAGSLLDLPDRTTAASSELLVARLLLPVNQNSFNTFNEYTSLLSSPRTDYRLRGDGGNAGYGEFRGTVNGGNDRVAYFGLVDHSTDNGVLGPNTDLTQTIWNGLAKVALGPDQSLLFDSYGLKAEVGDPGGVYIVFDKNSLAVPIRFIRPDHPDLDNRFRATISDSFVGYHNNSIPNHHFFVALNYIDKRDTTYDFDYFNDPYYKPEYWDCGRRAPGWSRQIGFQAQHEFTVGTNQILYGLDVLQNKEQDDQCIFCDKGPHAGFDYRYDRQKGTDSYSALYARAVLRAGAETMITLGARYDKVSLDDLLLPLNRRRVEDSKVSPELGIRWQITPRASVRVAGFRHLASHTGARLAPQLLAGFAVLREENAGTQRDEGNVAFDYLLPRDAFLSFGGYYRKVGAPVYTLDENYDLVRDTGKYKVWGTRVDLSARLNRQTSLYSEFQVRRIPTTAFDQKDLQESIGLYWIHPKGWFFKFTETYLRQTFDNHFDAFLLPRTSSWLTTIAFKKEFANKHARVGFNVSNLFNEDFNVVIEGLSVTEQLPARQANVFVDVTF